MSLKSDRLRRTSLFPGPPGVFCGCTPAPAPRNGLGLVGLRLAAVPAGACTVGGGGGDADAAPAGAGATGAAPPVGPDLAFPNSSPMENRSSRDLRCSDGGGDGLPPRCSNLSAMLLKNDRLVTPLLSVQTMLLAPWRVIRV